MGRHSQTAHKKKIFLEALETTLGVITQACKATGVGRRSVYEWRDKDPQFRQDMDDITEVAIDFAESQLFKQIQQGNTTATIFYLKTKGKERGYVERQEHAGVQNKPIEVKQVDLNKLSLNELEKLEQTLSRITETSKDETSAD